MLTKETGRFLRETPGSQSLERGLKLLRAFRLGNAVLTNAELANRTGLARPTVSRLTRSLVDAGFLGYDLQRKGYRLQAVTLSLAQVFRSEATLLSLAQPSMEAVAHREKVNVGLAIVDAAEMVYLESVRSSRQGVFRRIMPGSRVPIASTSLGHAYLCGLNEQRRREVLAEVTADLGKSALSVRREIRRAIAHFSQHGWCQAAWQPGMTSVATPILGPDHCVYALNISIPSTGPIDDQELAKTAAMLLVLAKEISAAWHDASTEAPDFP